MPTSAKFTFDINIERASYFLEIHAGTQPGVGAPDLARRELPRGAVVFAVGAIDAYISQVSAEVLVAQLQQPASGADQRETLKRVQAEVPTLALEIALLPSESQRLERIESAILDYFQNSTSSLGSKAVNAAVLRMGRKPSEVWTPLSEQFTNPADELDRWTEVRHQIVHRGMKPRVWRPHAEKFIDLAIALVTLVDSIASDVIAHPAA